MIDFAPGLEAAFAAPTAEIALGEIALAGELPAFLRGALYLVGPARFERGGQRYRHWLDGDGMVAALHFEDGAPRAVARYVRTEKWVEEEAAGRALYRTFGTAFPGDRLRRGRALASPANVSVHPFAGRLLVFGEQGLPYDLDPVDLATRGRFDFGCLNEATPFSAHPAVDPESGELVNFGLSFAVDRPMLHLFRFDPSGDLTARSRVELGHPYSVHDFSLSQRYAVFALSPYLLDVGPLFDSGATVAESLRWHPELGACLALVDRLSGELVASIPIGHRYCLHQVNAFDDGGELVVDFLELEEPVYPDYDGLPDLFLDVRPAHVVRLRVDPGAGRIVERRESAAGLAADFPVIDSQRAGGPCETFWMLAISRTGESGRKFFDRLQRFDWRRGGVVDEYAASPPRYLAGEPVFVPESPGAEAGVVLCHELDVAERCSRFLVLDAFDLSRGPVAQLTMPSPLHLGFHAAYHAATASPASRSRMPGRQEKS
ncbi:MAG: carotenoid oxygenase family protein [Thermoanaerobaculia bacterium]